MNFIIGINFVSKFTQMCLAVLSARSSRETFSFPVWHKRVGGKGWKERGVKGGKDRGEAGKKKTMVLDFLQLDDERVCACS